MQDVYCIVWRSQIPHAYCKPRSVRFRWVTREILKSIITKGSFKRQRRYSSCRRRIPSSSDLLVCEKTKVPRRKYERAGQCSCLNIGEVRRLWDVGDGGRDKQLYTCSLFHLNSSRRFHSARKWEITDSSTTHSHIRKTAVGIRIFLVKHFQIYSSHTSNLPTN